ncbi:mechanosensitive ion channel family protein [Agromyces lapidis]|uniref:Mechanosensitive ion channel family protein n=1 Tax=Agromyces lapidis TaxID=279574 RepID=A0ABV5SMQ0_9MICO|nr:mechanosensitive ion channel domain-containing protein [Agromyces lapidis]
MADVWASLQINGWSIAGIVITLLASWLLATLARKGVRAALARLPNLTVGVQRLAERIAVYSIWLLGIGISLSFLGASVQPVLAIALIVAVVLVLVLRGVADNFAASVVLQTRHPIALGDEIESGDFVGVVTELNGRAVVIRTVDGRTVHVPNGQVLQERLVNNSAHGARRSEIEVRVAAGSDGAGSDEVRALVVEATNGAEGVHRRESVQLRPIALAPDRSVYRVRFWHHPLHGIAVTDAVVDAVSAALAAHGIAAVVTSDVPSAPLTPSLEL